MSNLRTYIKTLAAGLSVLLFACASNTASQSGQQEGDAGGQVRVMAYNIHHANPPLRPDAIDIDAIAQVIRSENPDLVALQEVDVNTERSGNFNQAEAIAGKLGMHFYFGKAIDYQGGDYGVAILSRFPLEEAKVHRLPTQEGTGGEPRIVATAKVKLPDGTVIRFGSTHLDAQREPVNRALQIEEIVEIARKETLPFILAGDFNAVPDSEVIERLDKVFRRTCTQCSFTSSAQKPVRTIDYIAFRDPTGKLRVQSHHVVDEKHASDHLPVVADFKVSQGGM